MGASKTKLFSEEEKKMALVGRAYSHPARIRIMKILKERSCVRNCELIAELELCKKTVHDHLKKLENASLVKSEFFMNSYYIFKKEGLEERMINFLKEV